MTRTRTTGLGHPGRNTVGQRAYVKGGPLNGAGVDVEAPTREWLDEAVNRIQREPITHVWIGGYATAEDLDAERDDPSMLDHTDDLATPRGVVGLDPERLYEHLRTTCMAELADLLDPDDPDHDLQLLQQTHWVWSVDRTSGPEHITWHARLLDSPDSPYTDAEPILASIVIVRTEVR